MKLIIILSRVLVAFQIFAGGDFISSLIKYYDLTLLVLAGVVMTLVKKANC